MLKVLFARYFGIFYYIKDLFNRKRKLKDCFSTAPFDITFLALVIIILTVGLVMMFSASYVYAWYNAAENEKISYDFKSWTPVKSEYKFEDYYETAQKINTLF